MNGLSVYELRRRLRGCERGILELETRHGTICDEFRLRLEAGELGDPFSWSLEQDAVRWHDLLDEKEHWLSQL